MSWNFKNHMWEISCAWPWLPVLYKGPVCHRAQAGAVVCSWGALILKWDPSSPTRDTRREGDFSPHLANSLPLAAAPQEVWVPALPWKARGRQLWTVAPYRSPGICMFLGTGSHSILVSSYLNLLICSWTGKRSSSLFCAILTKKGT